MKLVIKKMVKLAISTVKIMVSLMLIENVQNLPNKSATVNIRRIFYVLNEQRLPL